MRNKKADPPSTVGGLEGIDKRVGSWGKKKKKRKKAKGTGRAPADLHAPLNKTGLVLEVKQIKEDTVVYLLIDYLKSPIGLSGLWMRQGEQA